MGKHTTPDRFINPYEHMQNGGVITALQDKYHDEDGDIVVVVGDSYIALKTTEMSRAQRMVRELKKYHTVQFNISTKVSIHTLSSEIKPRSKD